MSEHMSDPTYARHGIVLSDDDSGVTEPAADVHSVRADRIEVVATEEDLYDPTAVIENVPGKGAMRVFESGATRNVEVDPDYHGFLSPLALHAYGQYMHAHRLQADGTLRDSDNWQKGIPNDAFVRSLVRHVHDIQLVVDGYGELARQDDRDDNVLLAHLSAALFNVQGLLHNTMKTLLEDERVSAPRHSIPLNEDGTPDADDMFRVDEMMQVIGIVVGALLKDDEVFPASEVLSAMSIGMDAVRSERNQPKEEEEPLT